MSPDVAIAPVKALVPGSAVRKDAKGNTVLQVLQRAGGHFYYLQNGAVFHRLAPDLRTKSTAANEAVHRQVKRWFECVYQCHKERIVLTGRVFGVYKLLARAAQPTTMQMAESLRVAIVAGDIATGITPAFVSEHPPQQPTSRDQLRLAVVPSSAASAAERKTRSASVSRPVALRRAPASPNALRWEARREH